MALPDEPITRNEHYLAAIAGQEVELPEPITREEHYLGYIAEHGGGGGGGTAEDVTYDEEQDYSEGTVGKKLSSLSAQKVNAPGEDIPADYVPTSDGEGGYTWQAQQGGGSDLPLSVVNGKLCITYTEE